MRESMMKHLPKLLISSLFLSIHPSFTFAEQEDICLSRSPDNTYVDLAYHYLNTKFCQPVVWFDSFFEDNILNQDPRAGTMVRFYSDLSSSESDNFSYQNRLKVRVRLPRVTGKLKLIFESDDEDDRLALFSNNKEHANSSIGLQYDLSSKERSSFNIKVNLTPSIQARYRYRNQLTDKLAAGFTQKLYQKKKLTGEITQFYTDYSFSPEFLLRWANFAEYSWDTDNFELGTGLTLYQYISEKQALNYSANIKDEDSSNLNISNSHLSLTYRHNILRKWFFYEITPEMNWSKDIYNNRQKEASITLRLEVLFNNI